MQSGSRFLFHLVLILKSKLSAEGILVAKYCNILCLINKEQTPESRRNEAVKFDDVRAEGDVTRLVR